MTSAPEISSMNPLEQLTSLFSIELYPLSQVHQTESTFYYTKLIAASVAFWTLLNFAFKYAFKRDESVEALPKHKQIEHRSQAISVLHALIVSHMSLYSMLYAW